MKENGPPKWILITGLTTIVLAFVFYSYFFGSALSREHTRWAEFGSFFGGLLSPLLAFLAIMLLYHTLVTQLSEFKESVSYLAKTARIAADDLELAKRQTLDNETLAVLANAEKQISELLDRVVSESGKEPEVRIFHMCLEGRRLSNPLEWSDSYHSFVQIARTEGSVVWSYVHALHEVIESMLAILQDYSSRHSGQFSPTILYYHTRLSAVSKLLFDTEFISAERRQEIVTMADQHD